MLRTFQPTWQENPRRGCRTNQYKLSSNENLSDPYPRSPKFSVPSMRYTATQTRSQPKLREVLAKRFNLDAENIVTGAGSLGALNQILKAFAGVDADGVQDEVIYSLAFL